MKTVICTGSTLTGFTAGEEYQLNKRVIKSNGGLSYFVSGTGKGGEYEIKTSGGHLAEFKVKTKTLLKMLVRAFVTHARSKGWGDSKKGPHKSWSQTPFKNANEWARFMASGYDMKETKESILEYGDVKFIDQAAVDFFVDEEMSYF